MKKRKGNQESVLLSRARVGLAIGALCLGMALSRTAHAQAPAPSAEELVAGIYGMVSSPGGSLPDWNKVRDCFLKEAVVVLRTSRTAMSVFTLEGFIQDFIDFYERPFKTPEGTVFPRNQGFSEKVLGIRTWEYEDIAHVLVLYEARILGISKPPQQGIDSWQLVRRNSRWYISSITNELVTAGRTLPPGLQSDVPAGK